MNEQRSLIESLNRWVKHSVTLKLITITFLMLLLLIPSGMISTIICERESLSHEAISETSAKWANEQVIKGPILAVPLLFAKTEEGETKTWREYLHLLPTDLHIDGHVTPQSLRRGIYEVVVYSSSLNVSGRFQIDGTYDEQHLQAIQWDRASLIMGISDLRGIKEQLVMTVNGQDLHAKPGGQIAGAVQAGVRFDLSDKINKLPTTLDFEAAIDLQGSKNLHFVPLGGVSTVSLTSSWSDPSFDGSFLPDDRKVTEEGFQASWKVLELNRNFPQVWTSEPQNLDASAFGVRLLLPMDDYHKAIRSAKYGMMVIALTFLTFFLVEILSGKKIHPFQYALVGLAICLFYILLISLSEHLTFNTSYLLSMATVVTMVTLYTQGVFRNRRFTLSLLLGLTGIYGFLFVTLQVTDYALLMGSIGLTALLACAMYFTRHVDWYSLKRSSI